MLSIGKQCPLGWAFLAFLACAGCAGRVNVGNDSERDPSVCLGACEVGAARCSDDRSELETCSRFGDACPAFAVSQSCGAGYVCGTAGSVHCGNPEWAQWPVTNSSADVARGALRPTSFSWGNDGTVHDNVTGLIWTIDTAPDALPENAAETCEALEQGWRLPTLIELLSIVDYGSSKPSIDASAFPGTQSNFYWTASKAGEGTHFAVDFATGMSLPMQGAYPFRCVR